MADEASAAAILNEARGAHRASREILGLMQEPALDDPIVAILAALQAIQAGQRTMLARLDVIEQRLGERKSSTTERPAGSPD